MRRAVGSQLPESREEAGGHRCRRTGDGGGGRASHRIDQRADASHRLQRGTREAGVAEVSHARARRWMRGVGRTMATRCLRRT